MSIDYSDSVVVGFLVSKDDFLSPLVKDLPEKSHMEERYDPKTGKRLKDVKVVDEEAGEYYVFEDERYDVEYPPEELLEAIADKVGASIQWHVNSCSGESYGISIEHPDLRPRKDGGYNLEDVWAVRKDLERIEKKLRALGFDPGTMGIFSVLDAG